MDTLAIYIYPIPQGTGYDRGDLIIRRKVAELFDYCQIAEAVISKKGWDFLIGCYGYEQLFCINQERGWFDCLTTEEFISCIESEKAISPDKL